VALTALTVFVVVVAPAWHWRFFLLGVAIGLGACPLIVGAGRRATRALDPERRLRLRRQLLIYGTAWLLAGVLAGFGSAMVDSAWPDVLFLASLILTVVLLAAVVFNVRQRRRRVR
jgi:MFS family permease